MSDSLTYERAKPGRPVVDEALHARLAKMAVFDCIELKDGAERNRALKFARSRHLFFASRTRGSNIKLWRLE